MGIIFSEGSGLNNSVFGKAQAPIRMFLEKEAQAWEVKSALKDLFVMGTSENFGDMLTSMTAMEDWEPVGENGSYPETDMQESYTKTIVYETWKRSFSVTQEMVEDAKTMDFRQRPQAFVDGYYSGRENFGARCFAYALQKKKTFNISKRTFDICSADGLPLFDTAHPAKLSKKKQSNCFSDPFSADALGRMETAMQHFTGDRDELLTVAPDTILIPNDYDLKLKVWAAIGSDKKPSSSDNDYNFLFGNWRVIVWSYLDQYLTKSDNAPWILLDSGYNKRYGGAIWNDRVKMTIKSVIDEGTDANRWKGRARYNATFNNWRFAAAGGITGGTELSSLGLAA